MAQPEYKLSSAIIHTKGRMTLAPLLRAFPHATVVVSPGGGITDVWASFRRAWMSFAEDATHHVVFEDDLLPCLDAEKTILKMVELKPDTVMCYYHHRLKFDPEAERQGTNWLAGTGVLTTQAVSIPTHKIMEMLAFNETYLEHHNWGQDTMIGIWQAYANYYTTWGCLPTLFEHIGARTSALNYNNYKKVAYSFVGEEMSGLSIDWASTIDKPLRVSYCGYRHRGKELIAPKYWPKFKIK